MPSMCEPATKVRTKLVGGSTMIMYKIGMNF